MAMVLNVPSPGDERVDYSIQKSIGLGPRVGLRGRTIKFVDMNETVSSRNTAVVSTHQSSPVHEKGQYLGVCVGRGDSW